MKFISLLSKIGKGAEVVGKDALKVAGPIVSTAAMIDPALSPVAALVNGISRMVPALAPLQISNDDKKSTALAAVEAMTPGILELLLSRTGRTVTDEARFATAVDQLIEGSLNLFKSFGAVATAAQPVKPDGGDVTTTLSKDAAADFKSLLAPNA